MTCRPLTQQSRPTHQQTLDYREAGSSPVSPPSPSTAPFGVGNPGVRNRRGRSDTHGASDAGPRPAARSGAAGGEVWVEPAADRTRLRDVFQRQRRGDAASARTSRARRVAHVTRLLLSERSGRRRTVDHGQHAAASGSATRGGTVSYVLVDGTILRAPPASVVMVYEKPGLHPVRRYKATRPEDIVKGGHVLASRRRPCGISARARVAGDDSAVKRGAEPAAGRRVLMVRVAEIAGEGV